MANPTTSIDTSVDIITYPSGWNQWIYLQNVPPGSQQDTGNLVQKPDASLPYLYTPANGFWARSIISNCAIPWINTLDAFSAFMIGGGTTGTLAGSLGGIAVASELINISMMSKTLGIGRSGPAPSMGFCIGNKFKQQMYTRIDVVNTGDQRTVVTYSDTELLQNYKFKRMYVKYGEVTRYTNVSSFATSTNQEYILTLDINNTTPPPEGITISDTIKISNGSSQSFDVNITGIKNNWDLIISEPPQDIKPGYFYELTTPWCLEDPYLLSGFWRGTENEINTSEPSSGYNLYITSHIRPYEKGKFLGYYIWKQEATNNTSTTTTTTTTTIQTGQYNYQPSYGALMDDSSGFTWYYGDFGNTDAQSPLIYPSKTRYREVKLEDPDSEMAIVTYKTRLEAADADYNYLETTNNIQYIRVELSKSGSRQRHNWFAPCLVNSYIKCSDKLYKILGHVEYNIVDISIKSVDGTTKFNPKTNQEYEIINQYGWFINEHYDSRQNARNTGVFQGNVTSITSGENNEETILEIQTKGDTYISTTYKSNGLSFIQRYAEDVTLSSNIKKMYKKQNGWKLLSDRKSYSIKEVDFSQIIYDLSEPYPIKVTTTEPSDSFSEGDEFYIAFDKPYDTFGNYSRSGGYKYYAEYKAALSNTTKGLGFTISDSLCTDGEYLSNPYSLNISQNDRVGYCDGVYFGLDINGSARSNYSQFLMMTTPRAYRGTASLFHALRMEDWVVYEDAVTKKITVRRGSLQFTEYPKKSIITVGLPLQQETVSGGSELPLNQNYLWARRLYITFPTQNSQSGQDQDANSIVYLFGIGKKDNYYGFYISGDGLLDLQYLKRQNIQTGQLPPDTFTGDGYDVSPVYLYKPNYYQNLQTMIVDVGVKTDNKKVYINGGTPEKFIVDYVSDNQMIGNTGYFDVIRLLDGENVFIYGKKMGAFKLTPLTTTNATTNSNQNSTTNEYVNNSKDNGTDWQNSNAVMALGTSDDSGIWNTPFKNRIDAPDNDKYKYPLMILNSVDYLGCIYNYHASKLVVFVRAMKDNYQYLGCFITNMFSEKKYNHCTNITQSASDANNPQLDFLWTKPLILDEIIDNTDKSWTNNESLIKDGIVNNLGEDSSNFTDYQKMLNDYPDRYIRIMGHGQTKSQVTNGQEFGIISATMLPDGSYMVLFDSDIGIRALFSKDMGNTWKSPNFILAKNGRAAFLLFSGTNNPILFYIVSSGIEAKVLTLYDIYNIRDLEGNSGATAELLMQTTQTELNNKKTYLVGSGVIDPQRMSGYITTEGTYKIFFYDQQQLIKCMESKDGERWTVASNF